MFFNRQKNKLVRPYHDMLLTKKMQRLGGVSSDLCWLEIKANTNKEKKKAPYSVFSYSLCKTFENESF